MHLPSQFHTSVATVVESSQHVVLHVANAPDGKSSLPASDT
jgi:hypothetical protein